MNYLLSLICFTPAKPRRTIHDSLSTAPIQSTEPGHIPLNGRVHPSLMDPKLESLATGSSPRHKIGIPYIPPELIDEILAHLRGEQRTLKSCSLVCKAWVRSSRCHLFARVILNDKCVASFLAFSQRSTVLIPYLHHFQLNLSGHIQLWNNWIPQLVGFQCVRSLTLGQLSYLHSNALTQPTFLAQFTGIVSFCVFGPTEISGSHLAAIISSFPRLEVLDLGCMWRRTPLPGEGVAMSPRTISCHLHTLHTCGPDTAILEWILLSENPPELRNLYLNWISGTSRALNDLLPRLQSLEKLFISNHYDQHFDGLINLSNHERLRSLHIVHFGLPGSTEHVAQTLASITSTSLDEITFDVRPFERETWAEMAWSEVDAILQSPLFCELRTIQLIINSKLLPYSPDGHLIDPQLSTSLLPQCHARGILSVQSL